MAWIQRGAPKFQYTILLVLISCSCKLPEESVDRSPGSNTAAALISCAAEQAVGQQCDSPLKIQNFRARRHEKVCKMSANQNSEISNVHTYFGIKYKKNDFFVSICDLKGHLFTNKCFTCIVYSLSFYPYISFYSYLGQ